MINKKNGFDLHLSLSFQDKRIYAFAFIALFFCLLIIYGNSINGVWIFDDKTNIISNKNIHLKTLEWGNIQKTFYGIDEQRISRPVAYFSLALNYYFGQLNTYGYHVVNIFIHYLASIFLFLFIYRTLNLPRLQLAHGSSSYSIALLATFFWATNPVHVTAVTYIVQRMASMAGMFYIISMYFYISGRTEKTAWKKSSFFILCSLSATLALGTKENAVMLPISLYIYDLLLIQDFNKENLIKNFKYFILPAIILTFAVLVLFVDFYSIVGDYSKWAFTIWQRLLTETRVIVFYISLLLYPVSSRLMLDHDFIISRSLFDPWATCAAILAILSCIGLAVWIARKKPLISFCIIFYFLNHLIEGSFIPLDLAFEHRNYIPSMLFFVPLAVFAVHTLDYFSYNKVVQLMAAMLISFALFGQGHTVYMYNYLFKDPYLLWSDNAKKAPNLSRPHNNVGTALWELGLYDAAFKSYEKAYHLNRYNQVLMITVPINNIGSYYALKKDFEKAIVYFQKSYKIHPGDLTTWLVYAKTRIRMHDFKSAEEIIRQALLKWSDNVQFHGHLSFVLLKQGQYDEAIMEARKTLTIDSESTTVMEVLAEAHYRIGKYEKAVMYWENYISKYNDDLEGNLALIELYSKTGALEKLDKVIARVMVLKGSESWNEMIDKYYTEIATRAYAPDKQVILSIIKKNLLKDF